MINFDSSAPVKLKGVGDGFWLTLDPSHPENVLKSEIDKIFKNLKHLAINASVVIDVKDAKGHDDLIKNIKLYFCSLRLNLLTAPKFSEAIFLF